jgi:hypothetical protein
MSCAGNDLELAGAAIATYAAIRLALLAAVSASGRRVLAAVVARWRSILPSGVTTVACIGLIASAAGLRSVAATLLVVSVTLLVAWPVLHFVELRSCRALRVRLPVATVFRSGPGEGLGTDEESVGAASGARGRR